MNTVSLTSEFGLRPSARLGLRLSLALAFCLSLSQCAHSQKKPVTEKAAPRGEWYIASQDPLTYCPKGSVLPAANRFDQAMFVYLPDRRTRFYIPRYTKDTAHLNQALQLRQEAISASLGKCAKTQGMMALVARRCAQVSLTTLLCFGAGIAGHNGEAVSDALDHIWAL